MNNSKLRPQSAKLSFGQLNVVPDTYNTSRTSKAKKQYGFQKFDLKNISFDESNQNQSPYVFGNNIKVRKSLKQNSLTTSKIIDSSRFSNTSFLQQSLNFLKTNRPQSGVTKPQLDEQSFYDSQRQEEWNYDDQTSKKELYLDSFQLKTGYHQLQDDNIKVKSQIVKAEKLQQMQKLLENNDFIKQKIGQLKRQISDYKVLQQYAEPLLKEQCTISPTKKKQNENHKIISTLKREIKIQRDLIDQKANEIEETKKMLRAYDKKELIIEKKIVEDVSIDLRYQLDRVQLQNQVGELILQNDYEQIENIYQLQIRDLMQQHANLNYIFMKQKDSTEKMKVKYHDSNTEVISLRRQLQGVDAKILTVKEQIVDNQLKKGKCDLSKSSPQSPKEKIFIRQLEEEKQNLMSEKQQLQDEFSKTTKSENQKKIAIEQQKDSYLNAIDEKKEENQDILEQLHIIREQNKELIMKLQIQEKGHAGDDNINSVDFLGKSLQLKNQEDQNQLQNKNGINKNSSNNFNGIYRKSSVNSQKSSERESLLQTQSKYGNTQQKVISNYSPFETTNQKNQFTSEFNNGSVERESFPEIHPYNQDQQQQIPSQKQNTKEQPNYPLLNIKKSSSSQNKIQKDKQQIDLEVIQQNQLDQTTPKTSKRLEYFYSTESQKKSAKSNIDQQSENDKPFVVNSESIKQLKKKQFSNTQLKENKDNLSNHINNKKHLEVKQNELQPNRKQSDNKSNIDDQNSDQGYSAKSSSRSSQFQRMFDQKKVRKVSDMSPTSSGLANDIEAEDKQDKNIRENICFVDIERENFIDYLQKTINLEKECAKFENLIKNKELLSFPNAQNQLNQITYNQQTHSVINTIFGFDSNCFNYDVRKQRVKSSLIIQDLIVQYLEDQSTKKSFQIRSYEIHKTSHEKKRFDHNMQISASLGLPHILKQISLNTIALPELANSSFEFVNQFQIDENYLLQTCFIKCIEYYFDQSKNSILRYLNKKIKSLLQITFIKRNYKFKNINYKTSLNVISNIIEIEEFQNTNSYNVIQNIGNKEAFKAVIKRTIQSCTMVTFPIDTTHQLEMLLKEIELTSQIESSYVLKPLCSYVDREDQKYYLNIIYGSVIGNLDDFLLKYEVQESERIKLCYQIALGIQDIHLQNYIHTQLKPENIIINENFIPLITNLRESSSLNEQKVEKEYQGNNSDGKQNEKTNLAYTYQWVLTKCNTWQQKNSFTNQDLSQNYDYSFDLFSLGLVIYYVLTQKSIPSDFSENKIQTFEQMKQQLIGLDKLPIEQQTIIKICLEKKTSIQGILYSLRKLIEVSDLEEIHNTEQSLKLLPQEQTPEKQSDTFFEKGRLVCPIENGVVDSAGMLFRSNNLKQKNNILSHKINQFENKHEDMTTQMECLIGHFKGEFLQGKSIYIKQNEPYIQYMRDQNDKMIYVFDSNTDELISCKLHQQFPCIKGELDETFLDKLTDQNLQCTNHLVLPDKTELIRNAKNHTLILKKPGFGEIHYCPTNIKYYLPNDDFIMIETTKTFMYKSLNSSLNIILPTSSCKEKIQLSSKDYFFEFINVNPYYIITLSKKNHEKQPITAIFNQNFQLNTYLPAENTVKISNIYVNGGYLGVIINVKENTVIFGIFKSPKESIILQGFKISSNYSAILQDFDFSEQDNECSSPLKSIKRQFFKSTNN